MPRNSVARWIAIAAMLASFVSPSAAVAQEPTQGTDAGEFVPGEVVVVFAPGRDLQGYIASARSLAASFGAQVAKVSSTGASLLQTAPGADIRALAQDLSQRAGVRYAEPNYIYQIPDPIVEGRHANTAFSIDVDEQGRRTGVPVEVLKAMKSKRGSTIRATYPNDPNLWDNNGWDWIQADFIWNNTTASKGVCVLDTGVDYTHQDLTTSRVLKGKDWVNNDADPMDDNGHGTHVAGIITAIGNNGKGIMGVSNGKVVAVKVINAQGWGTTYDIAQGIYECANRTDVNILNMSLGGSSPSTFMYDAITYAVNVKGKLVVAAAGNDDNSTPTYPAGWSTTLPGKVMAVGAVGQWVEVDWDEDGTVDWYDIDNACKADYSNYGDWVNMWAPGTDILSTTPWDKPFYLNTYEYVSPRYGWLSGTSMATPFASAVAARTWGLFPTYTNTQIFDRVRGNPRSMWPQSWSRYLGPADDECFPATIDMDTQRSLNAAGPIRRGFIRGVAYDARTGNPLTGATVQVYTTGPGVLAGSGVIPTYTSTCIYCADKWVDVWFDSGVDVLNLPAADGGSPYRMKINKTAYTNGSQAAFLDDLTWGSSVVYAGIGWSDLAVVPPMSSDHTFVVDWDWWWTENDLDLNVWLPNLPKPVPDSQPAPFIVGPEGNAFGYLENDAAGAMTAFPYARWNRDGGYTDWLGVESVTIRSRASVPALPYYTGDYTVMLTDYGQWVDLNLNTVEDPGEALLGQPDQYPRLQIWQGGKVKLTLMMGCGPAHWWKAATITSGASGVPTYTPVDVCGDVPGIEPYFAETFSGRVEIQK